MLTNFLNSFDQSNPKTARKTCQHAVLLQTNRFLRCTFLLPNTHLYDNVAPFVRKHSSVGKLTNLLRHKRLVNLAGVFITICPLVFQEVANTKKTPELGDFFHSIKCCATGFTSCRHRRTHQFYDRVLIDRCIQIVQSQVQVFTRVRCNIAPRAKVR